MEPQKLYNFCITPRFAFGLMANLTFRPNRPKGYLMQGCKMKEGIDTRRQQLVGSQGASRYEFAMLTSVLVYLLLYCDVLRHKPTL